MNICSVFVFLLHYNCIFCNLKKCEVKRCKGQNYRCTAWECNGRGEGRGRASRQCTCTGGSAARMRLHRALCSTGASRLVMLQNFLEGFQDSARQSLRCLTWPGVDDCSALKKSWAPGHPRTQHVGVSLGRNTKRGRGTSTSRGKECLCTLWWGLQLPFSREQSSGKLILQT